MLAFKKWLRVVMSHFPKGFTAIPHVLNDDYVSTTEQVPAAPDV